MWERVAGGSLNGSADRASERILAFRDARADLVNLALRAPVVPDLLEQYLTALARALRADSAPRDS